MSKRLFFSEMAGLDTIPGVFLWKSDTEPLRHVRFRFGEIHSLLSLRFSAIYAKLYI